MVMGLMGLAIKNKIYISGMHSGQNPCSGLGIARCIRKAFPHLTLVGIDHWQGSSGLHDAVLDEVLLFPQWKQLDDEQHATHVRSLLNDNHLWISALDMEVLWLSENLGPHHNLLAPSERALKLTAKPAVEALRHLDFHVPDYIPVTLPDSDIHTFLRQHSWQCWLKSPYHDAKRISSWSEFQKSRIAMTKNWNTPHLFLQRHVVGHEETIAFAAYQGELLSAVHMEKQQCTPEGKTWAGRVSPVDARFFTQLQETIRHINWSGGGEIEFARDPDGKKWLIECNPRFPAWIYGAALLGLNVPAKLISHIWGLRFLEATARFPVFTRVVQEIPALESVGIPRLTDPSATAWSADGKYGKSGPPLATLLPKLTTEPPPIQAMKQVPKILFEGITKVIQSFDDETPSRLYLEDWTLSRFQALSNKVHTPSRSTLPEIRIGYSVKTSPTDDYLSKAKDCGFLAECISQMEVRRALDFGFKPNEIILNGPGKFWPLSAKPATGLHMLFCDSIEEFDLVLKIPGIAHCLGLRARLPLIDSRFGNTFGDFETFQRIVGAARNLKGKAELGFHFHMPSWAIGIGKWFGALQSLLIWCQSVEQLAAMPIKHMDLGGGFFPDDLDNLDFAAIQELIHATLPEVRTIYFEPGRALTQESEIIVSRVLDVRKTPDGEPEEIVVDACIAELPLAQAYTHRIFYRNPGGECLLLGQGTSKILGRICMENDILSQQIKLPANINIGDLVIFGDAGGYERSMSYGFGRG